MPYGYDTIEDYDQSLADEMAYAYQNYGGAPSYSYAPVQQAPSGGSNPLSAASDAYDAYQAAGLFGGGGSASGVTAGMAPLGGPATGAYSSMPISLGGQAGGISGGSPLYSGLGTASALLPGAIALYKGMFDMPSGKANWEKAEAARQASIMEPIMEKLQSQVPAGMSYAEYRDSRQSPQTPWDVEEASIRASGVGDVDNEVEMARQAWEAGNLDAGNAAWLAQGDNALWYNPDMTRTDYSGPNAPPLSEQRETGLFGAQNVRSPSVESIQPIAQQPTQRGNIYGQDVPRQTFGGKDLYADQKLYSGNRYKGY